VLAKLRKREKLHEPEEFDLTEIHRAAGHNIVGMIESYEFDSERFRRLQQLVVARLHEIDGSLKCGR
jgi:hypothetical protein